LFAISPVLLSRGPAPKNAVSERSGKERPQDPEDPYACHTHDRFARTVTRIGICTRVVARPLTGGRDEQDHRGGDEDERPPDQSADKRPPCSADALAHGPRLSANAHGSTSPSRIRTAHVRMDAWPLRRSPRS
jgi:hypothetical protein